MCIFQSITQYSVLGNISFLLGRGAGGIFFLGGGRGMRKTGFRGEPSQKRKGKLVKL